METTTTKKENQLQKNDLIVLQFATTHRNYRKIEKITIFMDLLNLKCEIKISFITHMSKMKNKATRILLSIRKTILAPLSLWLVLPGQLTTILAGIKTQTNRNNYGKIFTKNRGPTMLTPNTEPNVNWIQRTYSQITAISCITSYHKTMLNLIKWQLWIWKWIVYRYLGLFSIKAIYLLWFEYVFFFTLNPQQKRSKFVVNHSVSHRKQKNWYYMYIVRQWDHLMLGMWVKFNLWII